MSKDKPMKEEFKTVRRREDVRQHLKKFVKKQEPKVREERERERGERGGREGERGEGEMKRGLQLHVKRVGELTKR